MANFLLFLYFSCDSLEKSLPDDEFDALTDSYISKMIEMPELPRVGELIFTGNTLVVESVVHNLKDHLVEVHCDASIFDGVMTFALDEEGWDMKFIEDDGEEVFFKKLDEFKEKMSQRSRQN